MKKILNSIWMQLADGIEKSTTGTIIMFGCFALVAYLTFKEGGSDTVDDLITTMAIVGATLLGVNSVTDIFKVNTSRTIKKGDKSKNQSPVVDDECLDA